MTARGGNLSAGLPDLSDGGEHILIEDELGAVAVEPKIVTSQRVIENRLAGTRTEITLYKEGFVRVREGTAKRVLTDHLCELQYLDPGADKRAVLASRFGTAVALAGPASVIAALLPADRVGIYGLVAVAVLLPVTLILLWQAVRRSYVDYAFRTATGRAVVLRLKGNLGCLRQTRIASIEIATEIARLTGAGNPADERRLRAEMRAHYLLLERGVISREACSDGTAQILARFG